MSQTIDERVVEMKFDASQFNRNIDSSIQSINKLNTSIDSMSSGKGLSNLSKAAEKVDFSKAEFAATHAGFHIQDVFEKATRFLENNIASRLVNWGTNIAKSLTIEPVFTGFNEYEQKMGSVQTIMNGANATLEETMDTLEELNVYADKTIYSFSDMTSSIGKFTNAGVKLDDAVMAIKGISNEAAVSGANAAEAGRAMYNIAQALSTGSMKLIDWKSIENANMATMEFKKTLIETGIELNSIKKGQTSALTAEELIADPSKFRASIEGVKGQTWVTDKVMIEALKKYADETTEFGKKAYAAAQDVKTFTMLMDTLKEAAQSGWAVSMENILGNFEEAKAMWTKVNEEIGGLLDKSSDARNQVLAEWKKGGGRDALLNSVANIWFTLKDSIGQVKEVFQDIFPPITAKRLIEITKNFEGFTSKVRSFMKDASTMSVINNVFRGIFNALKGGTSVLSSFYSVAKTVFGYMTTAFSKVFEVNDSAKFGTFLTNIGKTLTDVSQKVKAFFQDSKNGENIIKIFHGIFSAIDLVRKGIVTIGNVAKSILAPILGGTGGVASSLLSIAGAIGEFITSLNNGASAISSLSGITDGIKNLGTSIANSIKNIGLFDTIINGITTVIEKLKSALSGIKIGDIFGDFKLPKFDFSTNLPDGGPLIRALQSIADAVRNIFDSLSKNLKQNDLLKPVFDFYNGLTGVLNGILTVATSLLNAIRAVFDGIANMFDTAPFLTISLLFNNIVNFFKMLNTGFALGSIDQTFQKLAGILDNFGDAFEGWLNESLAKAAKNFAIAIAIIAGALVVLSTVDPGRLLSATLALAAVAYGLKKAITSLASIDFEGIDTIRSSFKKLGMLGQLTTSLIKFAAAIAIVAYAMKTIGGLDLPSMGAALLSVIILMQALVKVAEKLAKMDPGKMGKIGWAMIEFSVGVRILASAINALGGLSLGQTAVALLTIIVAMKALEQVAKKLGAIDSKTILKTATALLAFSIAVRLIASAVTSIGNLGLEGVVAGLVGITVILGELVFAAKILGESKSATQAAIVLLALAVSIGILGHAISTFGNMSTDQLTQGMYAIVVAVGAMLAIARLLPEEFNKSAVALLACAVALNIVATAVQSFGEMNFIDMLQGLLGLGAAMAILAVGLKAMEGSLSGAAAMLIVSAGLVVFGAALSIFAEIPLLSMVKGLVGIAGALLILAVAMNIMQGAIVGALALTIAAAGLLAIAGAMAILGTLSFGDVVVGLVALVGAIAVLAGASVLLAPILPLMAALAAILLLLSASVAVVGLGLMLVGEALITLSSNGMAGVIFLQEFGKALLYIIPLSLLAAVTLTALSAGLLILTVALAAFTVALLASGVGLTVVGAGLLVLSVGLAAVAGAAMLCAVAFAAIAGNLGATVELLGSFSGDFLNAGKQLLTSFINGIKSMVGKAVEVVKNIGKKIVNGFKSFFGIGSDGECEEAYESGKAVGESYKKGLEESKPEAEAATSDFGSGLMDKFKSSFGSTELDPSSLVKTDGMGDLSTMMGGGDMTSMLSSMNGELGNTKALTGDSATNMSTMSAETKDTDAMLKEMGADSSTLANNTGDAAGNIDKISKTDVSNVEALSDANLDGLTDPKQVTELDKTKESIDAISNSVDEANDKKIKPEVDTSDIDKLVDDVMHGKYGNGMERMIQLAEKYGEVQNKVNEKLGSSKRYEEGVDYSKGVDHSKGQGKTSVAGARQSEDLLEQINKAKKDAEAAKVTLRFADKLPTSEKQKLQDQISEYQNLINKWNEAYTERVLSMRHGYDASYSTEDEYDYSGRIGAKDANDEGVRKAQLERLAEWQKQGKSVTDRNKEMLESFKKLGNQVETAGKQMEKAGTGLEKASQMGQNGSKLAAGLEAGRQRAAQKGSLTGAAKDKATQDAGNAALRDMVNNSWLGKLFGFDDAKKTQETVDRLNKEFNIAAYDSNRLAQANDNTAKSYENLGSSMNKVAYLPTEVTNAMKKQNAGVTIPVKADTKSVEQVPQKVQQTVSQTKGQEINIPVKADTQKVAYLPTEVTNAIKKQNTQVDIPVKADSTQVKTAQQDVSKLKATTEQTKDKKITISADAKGAQTAVDQFGKSLSKMSQSVDIETSKSKQAFAKFYTALQQTINTYTPMVISNFKSTFQMAITQSVNYLKGGNVISQFRSIGVNIGKGLADGIRSQVSSVKAAAQELSNAAASASKKTLKVKSPSRVFMEIGAFCGEGMADGFKASMGIVSQAAEDLGMASVNSAMEQISQLELDGIDTTPTIRPVLDMGDVESKAGMIDSLLNQQKAAKISAEVDSGKTQQRVQDQQMADQMQLMNQRLQEMSEAMRNPTPVQVTTDVVLEGDSKKFFEAMRTEDRRYQQTRGKSAFATG